MMYEHFDDESMVITGYTGSATGVILPGEINGLPVTRIGREAFRGCKALQEIRIPQGVTNIGIRAFDPRICGAVRQSGRQNWKKLHPY